ncbi:MAG: efflux RND transporter periplasmic adaptor subunit [Tenacibaculum sp.]|uniref:efflux RND transporter periplasmic adaptor subunit n=1 Tax=Tenacibaculum sp. TaxID=1906242 RepID=UPI00183A0BDA|nr:efflux RND transporter periplasmic adaptor subunit [Tenacibaculum sp.]NVK10098.1 efflux RND transporter periplasmic adaptor subunit [Tenacibaculum sp.]
MKFEQKLFLSLIFSLTLYSCTNKKESTTPETKNITESVYATGFIKAKNQYEVFGQTTGVIEKIFVQEGAHVKKGTPLFQIDNKNLKIATENAKLVSFAADYTRNKDKLLDAEKTIDLAKKNLIYDSLQFQRQKNLWSKNIGSKLQYEQKELNYQRSKAEYIKAKTNYNDLKRQLKLASGQSKNNLEIAQLKEDDFVVKSEINGLVYQINKEEGEINSGEKPVAIIGTEDFIIELSIDEKDIVKIKKGQQVIIRMDSYKSQVFEAKVISIEPMMNIRTRSFQAEAIFTNKPTKLFPNLSLEANIIIQTKQNALTIPRKYIINDTYVMLEGGQLQKVETGLMDYELVEIISGIDKSTKIQLP